MLRVCVGAVFIAHGARKLFGIWGGPGLQGTAAMLTALGLPYPHPLAVLLAVAEFGGGILLVLGGLTRWAALALALDMAVAIWKVHAANGFFLADRAARGGGFEFAMVLLAALVCLALIGPGAWSVDHRRSQSFEAAARGRARARKM
ncbi:MAG TPA: DoxX family protein [Vicinamibacterales bacterium]|nr:DoxX family protein [Vicinamibacterales bacterium]